MENTSISTESVHTSEEKKESNGLHSNKPNGSKEAATEHSTVASAWTKHELEELKKQADSEVYQNGNMDAQDEESEANEPEKEEANSTDTPVDKLPQEIEEGNIEYK